MGLNQSYLRFIESSVEQALGVVNKGHRMLELGDQVISDPNITEETGKTYFVNRGFVKLMPLDNLSGRCH